MPGDALFVRSLIIMRKTAGEKGFRNKMVDVYEFGCYSAPCWPRGVFPLCARHNIRVSLTSLCRLVRAMKRGKRRGHPPPLPLDTIKKPKGETEMRNRPRPFHRRSRPAGAAASRHSHLGAFAIGEGSLGLDRRSARPLRHAILPLAHCGSLYGCHGFGVP